MGHGSDGRWQGGLRGSRGLSAGEGEVTQHFHISGLSNPHCTTPQHQQGPTEAAPMGGPNLPGVTQEGSYQKDTQRCSHCRKGERKTAPAFSKGQGGGEILLRVGGSHRAGPSHSHQQTIISPIQPLPYCIRKAFVLWHAFGNSLQHRVQMKAATSFCPGKCLSPLLDQSWEGEQGDKRR